MAATVFAEFIYSGGLPVPEPISRCGIPCTICNGRHHDLDDARIDWRRSVVVQYSHAVARLLQESYRPERAPGSLTRCRRQVGRRQRAST